MQEIIDATGIPGLKTDERPDGTVTVICADDMAKITFGPSKAVETGQVDGYGYDWAAYYRTEENFWETQGSDWAATASEMTDVLAHYLRCS